MIVLSAREIKTNYSVIFDGYPNELLNILLDHYKNEFKKLTGDEALSFTRESIAYLFDTSYRIYLTCNSLPIDLQIKVKSDVARAMSGALYEVVLGRNLKRFKYEKAKYDLQFLERSLARPCRTNLVAGDNVLHVKNPRVKLFHMELNPHMTVEFAIKYFNKKWDVRRFAMNAALKWADLERFLEEGCDLNKVIDDLFEPHVEFAHGYLKNPNITVKEFRKLKKWLFYDGMTNNEILSELSGNMFAWHPVIYRRRVNIARKTRKDIVAPHIQDVLPNCVGAAILRYCDHY